MKQMSREKNNEQERSRTPQIVEKRSWKETDASRSK